ncbi:hypothetical protein F4809DRAFT_162185 [Biscogniauxia mediterranea]|nr:hypothetical protein F4809DRAFT_162185 [Biscogniauxia mediterranea]
MFMLMLMFICSCSSLDGSGSSCQYLMLLAWSDKRNPPHWLPSLCTKRSTSLYSPFIAFYSLLPLKILPILAELAIRFFFISSQSRGSRSRGFPRGGSVIETICTLASPVPVPTVQVRSDSAHPDIGIYESPFHHWSLISQYIWSILVASLNEPSHLVSAFLSYTRTHRQDGRDEDQAESPG